MERGQIGEKRKRGKRGVVGKQINSSVGSSRVFSGEAPNICSGRSSLIRSPGCIYTDNRESLAA